MNSLGYTDQFRTLQNNPGRIIISYRM